MINRYAPGALLACLAVVIFATTAMPVHAEEGRRIEEVVVTAERREASVQDTSISITAFTGEAPEGSPDTASRLDALEQSVARIQKGLDDCRQQQKELALAITSMFDRIAAPAAPAPPAAPALSDELSSLPAPPAPIASSPFDAPVAHDAVDVGSDVDGPSDGPINGLALNG